ncbi:hypothetical protein F4604DRAFT_1748818 [Suillus subluteus]|nr:hypothetical protein F4604DRAFT_1748818 [Suillus subluteus]
MNRDTRAAWLSNYKGLMDQTYDAVTGDRRSCELTRLILRLHVMLSASRKHVLK